MLYTLARMKANTSLYYRVHALQARQDCGEGVTSMKTRTRQGAIGVYLAVIPGVNRRLSKLRPCLMLFSNADVNRKLRKRSRLVACYRLF